VWVKDEKSILKNVVFTLCPLTSPFLSKLRFPLQRGKKSPLKGRFREGVNRIDTLKTT